VHALKKIELESLLLDLS